jgi:hypothetical protein
MTGHNPKGDAPESVPPDFPMPPAATVTGVHPETPAGSPAGAVTPGQAFRTTLIDRWTARNHCVDSRSYDQLPEEDRADLEAAAKAAAEVSFPRICTQLAAVTAERDALDAACKQADGVREVHWLARQQAERERDELRALIDAGQPALASEVLQLREQLTRALAANQRWGETLERVARQYAILKAGLHRIAMGHKIASQAQASVIADQALTDAAAPERSDDAPGTFAAIAAELERLSGEAQRKAAAHDDRSYAQGFHRGVSAGLGNAGGRIRHALAAVPPDGNTPGQASLLGFVDAHFIGNGPYPLQLVCTTEDASDVECDETIAEVEPGATWDELEARIVAHAAERHARDRESLAAEPPDGSGQAPASDALIDELAELIPLTMARSTATLAGDQFRDVARAVLARLDGSGQQADASVWTGADARSRLGRGIHLALQEAFKDGVMAGVRLEAGSPGVRPRHAASVTAKPPTVGQSGDKLIRDIDNLLMDARAGLDGSQ